MTGDRTVRSLPVIDTGGPTCGSVVGGLTDEEVAILSRLRALHEEAVALRAAAAAGACDAAAAESRIAELRRLREALVEERDAARHRRMVLLGHEEGDGR